MHAAVITGQGRVELLEFPQPEPRPDGAVVDIELCGICGTDVHAFQSGAPYNPAICGHEWTGTVSAVGADVRSLREGDRVAVGVPPACGRCEACRAGHAAYCNVVLMTSIGLERGASPYGGFAPQIATSAARLIPVLPSLNSVQAAQVEPAAVAFHAVRHTQPHLGDVAVVQGAGPIGLVTLQAALAGGAGCVVVVEPNAVRRSLALTLGATHAVHPDDAAALVAELTRGLGADVVYECVGRPDTVQQAVGRARRGGRMCLIGLANEHAPIDPTVWLLKEIKVSAALAYTHDDFDRTMGMIADGRLVLDPLHTGTVGLADVGAAIADLASGTSSHTKVLVDPRR
ncbi:MAG TPA: alcohol dehydrogenase [Acidimicrobiaceae bacterium]|nr:alcohol dehydrogenase [Acidimicrobiaceae bacterium]